MFRYKPILTLSVGVGGVGGVEESTLRLNSAQFQLKLPAGAELGNKPICYSVQLELEFGLNACT